MFCFAGFWFALGWFVGVLVLLVVACLRWITLFVGLCLLYLLVGEDLVVIVLLASIYCCNFVFIICFLFVFGLLLLFGWFTWFRILLVGWITIDLFDVDCYIC